MVVVLRNEFWLAKRKRWEAHYGEIMYLGIDLGTSNSAAAIFDGSDTEMVLNGLGNVNTPSVVWVSAKGLVIGEKAKRQLFKDSANTYKEFKRLMGTQSTGKPDRTGQRWTAEALSAEVLKSLKKQAETQASTEFDRAVITVPALFELPQSRATSEAARLAGFSKVELLPEPVASALASGWSEEHAGTAWLVYDLGGGTFDVSLLEARDGLLRVVAHGGDNFLGGRDFDRVLVNWFLEQLQLQDELSLDPSHPDYHNVLRRLEHVAEEVKIALSKELQVVAEIEFEYDDAAYEIDLPLTRQQFSGLCEPLVRQSIDICLNLLRSQGLPLQQLSRVVLVGGPAHMPVIQSMVKAHLAPLAESDEDPMCLVAKGAALFAATAGLGCEPKDPEVQTPGQQSYQWWLQFPTVCSELNPAIMGRLVDTAVPVHAVVIARDDASWTSAPVQLDDTKLFMVEVPVRSGRKNSFVLTAYDAQNRLLETRCQPIHIVHGVSISDPPLARSIGLSLADGTVKTFIERGTPLPAKRSFVQHVVDILEPGSGRTLTIPIVQGERRQARFCRKVGGLIIDAAQLKQTLPVGSAVEITIEVDRGGDLRAQAFLPGQDLLVDGVAQLVMDDAEPATIRASWQALNSRLTRLQRDAFRDSNEALIGLLTPLAHQLHVIGADMPGIEQDTDARQRITRTLMEIEAEVDHFEGLEQVEMLAEECERLFFSTSNLVQRYGDVMEKQLLDECSKQFTKALKHTRQTELERIIERLEQLFHAVHRKTPDFWYDIFQHWSSLAHLASDRKKARVLVDKGIKAMASKDVRKLEALSHELYALMPEKEKHRQGSSYDSGIY